MVEVVLIDWKLLYGRSFMSPSPEIQDCYFKIFPKYVANFSDHISGIGVTDQGHYDQKYRK